MRNRARPVANNQTPLTETHDEANNWTLSISCMNCTGRLVQAPLKVILVGAIGFTVRNPISEEAQTMTQTPGQSDPYDQTRMTSTNPPPVNPQPGGPAPDVFKPAGTDHSSAGAEPPRPPQHGEPQPGQYEPGQYGQGQYGQGQYWQGQQGSGQPGQYGGQQAPQQYGSNQPQYGASQSQPQYGAPQGQPQYGQQAPYQQGGQQPYQAGQNPYSAPQHDQGQQQPYGSAYGSAQAAPPVSQAVKVIGLVIAVIAVVIAISAFLPWVSGTFSESGLGGGDSDTDANDGVLTLVLAVIAGIFGVISVLIAKRSGLHLTAGIVAVVTGILVALIAIVDITDILDAKETAEVFDITIDVGIGLWLTLVGGIGLVIAGVAGIIKRK